MNTTTPIANGREDLTHGLRHVIDQADQFLRGAARSGDEKFDAVRDTFVEQIRHLRAQLDELEDSAVHKARHAARVTDQTVHSHPYGAMGMAAAAGLLIGFLAARR